jgi:16S rRNA (guanine966-N2)-methyltransferase
MRIIAGQWRGRKLVPPEGMATRPTGDRVRETLFSMLASRLGDFDDLKVADLYAGSGGLGFEALSRGAALACFVEQDRSAVVAIRANADSLGAGERATIITGAAETVKANEPFDLVFADPPYAAGSGSTALTHILANGWAAPNAWISIETERGDRVDPHDCTIDAERDVGRARLTLLRA